MPIKLHRCSNEWVKINAHPCWKVQKALDDEGIEYELVKGPVRSSKREALEQLSGQRKYPVIEFEDGTSIARSRRRWRRESAPASSAPPTSRRLPRAEPDGCDVAARRSSLIPPLLASARGLK